MTNSTVTISTTLTSSFEPTEREWKTNTYRATTECGFILFFVANAQKTTIQSVLPVHSPVRVTGELDDLFVNDSWFQLIWVKDIEVLSSDGE